MSAFACVGVETQHRNMRVVNAKLLRERLIDHRECALNKGLIDGIRHVAKRQVGRCQRDSQVIGYQQHHYITHLETTREILRVAAKGNPRLIDDTFLHRCGDHALTFLIATQFDGEIQLSQHLAGVARVECA